MTGTNNAQDQAGLNDGAIDGQVALIGICSDQNSTFKRGPAQAPPLIREALHNGSAHWTAENGIDLQAPGRFLDLGDRQIADGEEAFLGIEAHLTPVLERRALPLVLGGDHAITYPILRAVAKRHGAKPHGVKPRGVKPHGALDILHFDAHSDLYDNYEGNRLSHACPFARIMEEGLAKRLVQIGIRTTNATLRAQADRFGVEIHEMRDFDVATFQPSFERPIYLTFDMDCLDPAFAPGISHFEPGGFSVRDVLTILHRVQAPILAADIVEFNPRHDIHGITAMVGAKMVKEIAAQMISNSPC